MTDAKTTAPAPQPTIEALYDEDRTFPPPPGFVEAANLSDPSVYERASADPEAFWAEQAESLAWYRRWDTVLDWKPPFATWFAEASSTWPTTASTGTSKRASGTRSPSIG
ncbi:MAG TPA: acetyl-coenzyme A synthetase N-terminal domain-containing protein, partial [Thermomicrobiales bacterium]|nr:acetyl-coenzyme A synthetase N-terminal domain-containing protein [Thermomicrobiales bacterium]